LHAGFLSGERGAGLATMAGALMVPHGRIEIVFTIIGVSLVALAHHLNGRALAS